MPSNVLPLPLKQTLPSIIWMATEGKGDEIESRLHFKIFFTLTPLNERVSEGEVFDLHDFTMYTIYSS